jgi:hypothetical protein
VATFLESQGADVVLVSSTVAYWNRRTQDGTWDKDDRKDAANRADLLEQGKVLFYSQPEGPLAERLPAYPLLRTIPGIGPTVGAILLAEIGDIAWFTQFSQLRKLAGLHIVRVQSGQFAGQAWISKCGRGLLRWALYQAAMGVTRTAAGRTRLAALKAKRQGDRYAGFKAVVELAAKVLRIVWGVGRSGTPYDPLRTGGLRRQPR